MRQYVDTITSDQAREMYAAAGDASAAEGDAFADVWDYGPILASVGEVLVRVDEDDYQGDTLALVKRAGEFGVVVFGWGSCSGCDALQAANSWVDVAELRNSIFRDTKWASSLDEVVAYLGALESRQFVGEAVWEDFTQKVVELRKGSN